MLYLTAAQAEFWRDQLASKGLDGRFVRECIDIFDPVDSQALVAATRNVVLRTEVLWLMVEQAGDHSIQRTVAGEPNVVFWDLSAEEFPEEEAERRLESEHRRLNAMPWGVSHMFAVIKFGPEHHRLDLSAHHFHLDGYSGALIVREIFAAYHLLRKGLEPARDPLGSIADLVAQDLKYQASDRREKDRKYWRAKLEGFPGVVTLAKRPRMRATSNHSERLDVGEKIRSGLADVAAEGLSSPGVLVATAAILLYSATGEKDVTVGFATTSRLSRAGRETPGTVANVLPLRLHVEPEEPVRNLVAAADIQIMELLRHQCFRGMDLAREIGSDEGINGLCGLSVNFMANFDMGMSGMNAALTVLDNGLTDDVFVSFYDKNEHCSELIWYANAAPYRPEEAVVQADSFRRVLGVVVADPGVLVGQVDEGP